MPRIATFTAQSTSPTCGICHKQMTLGESFAGVLYDNAWNKGDGLREVRCAGECADFLTGCLRDLRAGDVVWSPRYQLTEWGPRIKARIVHLTDDRDDRGWRAVWLEPADPADQSPIEKLRAIGAPWAMQLADEIGTVDPLPSRVWISDDELIHYSR